MMNFSRPKADAEPNPIAARIEAARTALPLKTPAGVQGAEAVYRSVRAELAKAEEALRQSLRADFSEGARKPSDKSLALQKEADAMSRSRTKARQALDQARADFGPTFADRITLPVAAVSAEIADILDLLDQAVSVLADINSFAAANGFSTPIRVENAPAARAAVRSLRKLVG